MSKIQKYALRPAKDSRGPSGRATAPADGCAAGGERKKRRWPPVRGPEDPLALPEYYKEPLSPPRSDAAATARFHAAAAAAGYAALLRGRPLNFGECVEQARVEGRLNLSAQGWQEHVDSIGAMDTALIGPKMSYF